MSDPADRVWQAMRELVLDNERRKEVCDVVGLSFVRIKALLALLGEPLTMGDLATRLSTDPPYTTLIVDDLQQRGMVTRTAHPTDRRAKVVTLTSHGGDTAVAAQRLLDEPPAALRALTTTHLAELDSILGELAQGGRPPMARPNPGSHGPQRFGG
jgi:DNA-binding MarR family transcriptional regulator